MPDSAAIVEEHLKREIGEWIVSATLAGTLEVGIVTGVGQRLNAAGVSHRADLGRDRSPRSDVRRPRRALAARRRRHRGDVRPQRGGHHRHRGLPAKPVRLPVAQRQTHDAPAPRRDVSAGRVSDARPVSGPWRHRLPGRLRARRRIHSSRRNGGHRRVVDDGRAGRLYRRAGRLAHRASCRRSRFRSCCGRPIATRARC